MYDFTQQKVYISMPIVADLPVTPSHTVNSHTMVKNTTAACTCMLSLYIMLHLIKKIENAGRKFKRKIGQGTKVSIRHTYLYYCAINKNVFDVGTCQMKQEQSCQFTKNPTGKL